MHGTEKNTTLVALAIACGVFLAPGASLAQTASPASPAASSSAAPASSYTAQGNLSPTADQVQTFVQSLENFVTQSMTGVDPTVGKSVPQNVKTQPMPPAAAAAVPEVKDHHVVKADDQTILIVDPVTRQIVGVISAADGSSTTGVGTPNAGSNGTQPASSK